MFRYCLSRQLSDREGRWWLFRRNWLRLSFMAEHVPVVGQRLLPAARDSIEVRAEVVSPNTVI
jgi:hypothetical protein